MEIEGLRVAFATAGATVTVLDVPRLLVRRGASLGIEGPSGSGKTTLLNAIAGLITPVAGRVSVHGREVNALPPAARDRFRAAEIGYVFQTFNLLPPLTVLENVLLSMGFAARVAPGERRARALGLLERVGLSAHAQRRPAELSHGEQQRVGIARALANRPGLVLADEPTASLEPGLTHRIGELLAGVCREQGATLIVASHDPSLLAHTGERVQMEELNTVLGGSGA